MSADFTLRQLEYFVAVLDTGSVTQAAKRASISQAAASVAIGQLEKALGVELFLRTRSRRLVPTAAGEALAARARRILADAAEVPDLVRSDWDGLAGRVRVGCTVSISPRLIPRLAREVLARWPGIDIEVREGANDELQRAVANGEADVAFVFGRQALPDVEAITVVSAHPHILLSADHRLARSETLRFAEVADEDVILFDVPPSAEHVTAMFESAGVQPRARWRSSVGETVREMVANGFGFSVMNVWPGMVASFAAAGISAVPIADATPPNSVVATVARGAARPRRVDAVIEAAQAVASRPS
ncbi:LysR family transcriptional regulator [Sinomonas flava]|uniref:LysR family transcriptional regulator n=1 Tax=Sinomonas flava TaxID=496857 RepID=UPI0039A6A91D